MFQLTPLSLVTILAAIWPEKTVKSDILPGGTEPFFNTSRLTDVGSCDHKNDLTLIIISQNDMLKHHHIGTWIAK